MQEISMALRHAPEYWTDIKGYPNYSVSNLGRVRSKKTGKILKPYKTNRGYLTVGFWSDGKKKRLSIHRLVAQAFIQNLNNLPEVNHINGCKADNNVNNLEWSSGSANISHAYQTGLRKAKLTNSDKEKILQLIEKGFTQRAIGKLFNVSHSAVGNIKRNRV